MSRPKKYAIRIIIILLMTGAAFYYFISPKKPRVEYLTETARRADLTQTVSLTGKIIPEGEYDLSFEGGGRIISLNFEVGDKVKKGDKIGSIAVGTLYSQLAGVRAEIEAQKKTLASMKKKKDTYDKNQRRAQKEIIKKAEASMSAVYDQLRGTAIYSPVNGVVIRKNYIIGEVAPPGVAVITVLEEGDLMCEINVSESDILKLKTGQLARMSIEAFPSDTEFSAEVTEIEPAATIIQGVVYYKARLSVSPRDSGLKSGMSADVDIKTAEVKNAVVVPLRSVKTEGDREFVEVLRTVDDRQFAEKIYVETGLRGDEALVEIISGLNGGEEVITLIKNGK